MDAENNIYRLADDTMVRQEPFGYILAFPDGEMNFYSPEVSPLIKKAVDTRIDKTEFSLYITKTIKNPQNPDWNFVLNHPLIVSLEMTRACNAQCEVCFINAGEPRQGELSNDEMRDIWKQIVELKPFCVQLTGGESLMHPLIMEAVDYFHSQGIVLSLATNGILLTREIIKKLPRKDFGLTISIDSLLENDKIRGDLASFDNLLKKIQMLKEEDFFFGVLATLSKLNINSILPLIDWCKKNDVLFDTVEAHPIGRGLKNSHLVLDENDLKMDAIVYRAKEELEDYYESKYDCSGRFFAGFMVFGYRYVSLIKGCKGSRAWIYIASDGSVYPCSNCAGMDIYKGGNLKHESLSSIWQNSFKEMRKIQWQDFSDCENCEVGKPPYFCVFRCPALSYANSKEFTKPGCTKFLKTSVKIRSYIHAMMHSENEKKAKKTEVANG
jgi:radical SAM protein with 4Fe4S-binding SPASM domain